MRIIIDTNLWISFIISNRINEIDTIIIKNNVTILFNQDLILEIKNTIKKPKLQKYFGNNSFNEMLDVFNEYIEMIDDYTKVKICRDEKDNFLLNLSIDGNADYLITGDSDLLVLNQIEKTKIITINDFITLTNKTK